MNEIPNLEDTTSEQRIHAAATYYLTRTERYEFARGLEHALQLIQPDGWIHVAPAWFVLPERRKPTGVSLYETPPATTEQR